MWEEVIALIANRTAQKIEGLLTFIGTDDKQSLLPQISVRPTPVEKVLRKDPYARDVHHVSIDVGGPNCIKYLV